MPTRCHRRSRSAFGACSSAALCVLGGCSTPPGAIFDAADAALRWPPTPNPAHVAYIGQLATDRDLKPGRSGTARLGDALFGRDPAQSMTTPLAVCTDGDHRVFIADAGDPVVHVFDLRSRRYARWAPPPEIASLTQPVGVAYDPTLGLIVSDSAQGALFLFETDGRFRGTIGDNQLGRPVGVAIDAERQRLFVADAELHQVFALAFDGEEIARIGRRGSGPGEFNFPTNLALDADGRLYVSDSLNFRVQVFTPDMDFDRVIGRKGDRPGYFAQPKGLAIDPDGHLYVVDAHFEAVQVFDPGGRLLMTFGSEGRGPGEFWLPAGMFIEPKGRIWIADSYNHRVQVFDYLSGGAE